eukprot:849901_1
MSRKRKRSHDGDANIISPPLKKRKLTPEQSTPKQRHSLKCSNDPDESNGCNANIKEEPEQSQKLTQEQDAIDDLIIDDIKPALSKTVSDITDELTDLEYEDIDIRDDPSIWSCLIPTNKLYTHKILKVNEFRIGRLNTNHLILDAHAGHRESTISNNHCTIKRHCHLLTHLTDHSTNGTFINGHRYHKRKCVLTNGDFLSFGKPNQLLSYWFFDLRLYRTNESDSGKVFNVSLQRDTDDTKVLVLCINQDIWRYDERKYEQNYTISAIVDCCVCDHDVAFLISEFYGNIFDHIAYHVGTTRPPIMANPLLHRYNCNVPTRNA